MNFLVRPLYWLAGRIFAVWARPAVQPETPAELIPAGKAEICYVLESGGLADLLALERACESHGLPSPSQAFHYRGKRFARRVVTLRPLKGFWIRLPAPGGSRQLRELVASANGDAEELLLVPVAIYWGRSPEKEKSIFKLMFSENWTVAGRTRKFFATLLHGRNTLLRYSSALPLTSITQQGLSTPIAFRKLSRILRVHFRQRRTATVGPDLSHRRTVVKQALLSPSVRKAIAAEAGDDPEKLQAARDKARAYAMEIAADISYPTIRMIQRLLRWLWNRIYDGIELNHVERLHDVARNKEVIYAPCHRSHFDYLLLGYVLYGEGLQLPHIAAGINLNLPIIGPILRRGGAFFLRRSFRGNRLYATVFNAYLHQLLLRGHAIEYFVEGGRSRTGRLLEPKAGMLAMTVRSYIKDPEKPVVFVPIYFGYEKLIEGDSFINELGGGEKKSESLFGLIRSLKSLREDFGRVYVNIGAPVELEPYLDAANPDWRSQPDDDERPAWLNAVIDKIGAEIMCGINAAAAVTPISLLAYVLLASPKLKIGAAELESQLRLTMELLHRFRYSDSVTVPDWTPAEIVAHGEKLNVISREPHPMGDVIDMPEHTAVLMTYFRNNILHLLALPASVACCFIHGRRLAMPEIQRLMRLIYPYMSKELTLRRDIASLADETRRAVDALVDAQLLSREGDVLVRPPAGSAEAYRLLMLGQTMVPMLQRFYLVVALLVRHGSGTLSRVRLEKMCQLSAERLSMIYGLHSPDFFTKTLFHDFIRVLQNQGVLHRNENGLLDFDEVLVGIGADARLVLGEGIRHSILSLTVPESLALQ